MGQGSTKYHPYGKHPLKATHAKTPKFNTKKKPSCLGDDVPLNIGTQESEPTIPNSPYTGDLAPLTWVSLAKTKKYYTFYQQKKQLS